MSLWDTNFPWELTSYLVSQSDEDITLNFYFSFGISDKHSSFPDIISDSKAYIY